MNVNQAPAPDVAGPAEVRRLIGNVTGERLRQIIRDHPEFPAYRTLVIGRVWDRAAVKAWQFARTNPRRRQMVRLVAHYRRHGILAAAARHVDIHETTARAWLRELEIPTPSEK